MQQTDMYKQKCNYIKYHVESKLKGIKCDEKKMDKDLSFLTECDTRGCRLR